jgi:lysozyme family protein
LSRYTAEVLVRRSTLAEEANLSFEDLEPRYAALYSSCRIRPERVGEVAWHRKKLVQYRPRYEAVSAKTGIPWWFIGVVHALEASFSFFAHLHNGDPLTGRTIQVPKNRPVTWNPPSDWESSAIDALTYEKLVGLADWSVSQALYRWESYNGFGYYSRQVNSPYLWSFSNHYTKGKFVADGKYDPHAVSKQCGAAVMLRALEDAGLVTTGSS